MGLTSSAPLARDNIYIIKLSGLGQSMRKFFIDSANFFLVDQLLCLDLCFETELSGQLKYNDRHRESGTIGSS